MPAKKQILDFERKTKDDPTVQTGLSMEQLKAQKAKLAEHQQKAKQAVNDQTKAEKIKRPLKIWLSKPIMRSEVIMSVSLAVKQLIQIISRYQSRSLQKALQEQQTAETARRTAQQLDQLNQEIKTTKQKRRQAVIKELTDNQLNYNNGEAVTEDNLEEVEKAMLQATQEQLQQAQQHIGHLIQRDNNGPDLS